MFKSSPAARARGEPTTPRRRPLELEPDSMTRQPPIDYKFQVGAEPRHRTKKPTKSALKSSTRDRADADPDVDSGYGSSIDHGRVRPNVFRVHNEPLKPPGPSGTPLVSTAPLAEADPLQSSRRAHRRQDHPDPPPSEKPVGWPSSAIEYVGYDHHDAPTRRDSHRTRTLSEKLPENSTHTSERGQYEPIPPRIIAPRRDASDNRPRYQNYGATQNPHYGGLPPHAASQRHQIYGPPQSQPYPYHPQAPGYAPQAPTRTRYTEDPGHQSESESRPPHLPRPARYQVNATGGYFETEEMSRNYGQAAYGSSFTPQDLTDREQYQRLRLNEHGQPRGGPSSYPRRPPTRVTPPGMQPQPQPPHHHPPNAFIKPAIGSPAILALPTREIKAFVDGGFQMWNWPMLGRTVSVTWPLLEYRIRKEKHDPMIFFDVSQPPTSLDRSKGVQVLRKNDSGMSTQLTKEDADLPFTKEAWVSIVDMRCGVPELAAWDVIVQPYEGDKIRVRDVFQKIYDTYQVPLTQEERLKYHHIVNSRACQEAFKRRCRNAPMSTLWNEQQGIRRIDLAGDRTLFLMVHGDGLPTRRYMFDLAPQDPVNMLNSRAVRLKA
ncbi:hypothetical protein H0H87_008014 [Tephrocybe sp. NHM501043]|nr:hypothetical protein H0H87_008014 [Tephrocybe sp. NHM501043]